MAGNNGKHLSQELKTIAQIVLQNDEKLEEILDAVIEIKILLIESGSWPRTDEQVLKDARRKRADAASLVKMQRRRLWKSLGLDD